MAAEELVQRVVAGDVQRKPTAARASGPTPLLAEARNGAGERDRDRRVQVPDVDPELEGVGRHDSGQLPGGEIALDLAPLLRRVAGSVGGDAGVRVPEPVERHLVDQLRSSPAAGEADRAHAAPDE